MIIQLYTNYDLKKKLSSKSNYHIFLAKLKKKNSDLTKLLGFILVFLMLDIVAKCHWLCNYTYNKQIKVTKD